MIKWLIENVGGWVLGLIAIGIFIGVSWLLGQTGLMARRGLVQKRPVYVIMPVALWTAGYGALYHFSSNTFLLSLLLLIPVVMGFFGYFFKMGSD